MRLWLALVTAFLFQEVISTTTALSVARHMHVHPLIINALWLAVALFETAIMYSFGILLRTQYTDSRLATWLKRFPDWFEKIMQTYGRTASLGIFSFLLSPGIGALLAGWLDLPFFYTALVITATELVWFVFDWGIVVGVMASVSNFVLALSLVLTITIIVVLATNAVRKRIL